MRTLGDWRHGKAGDGAPALLDEGLLLLLNIDHIPDGVDGGGIITLDGEAHDYRGDGGRTRVVCAAGGAGWGDIDVQGVGDGAADGDPALFGGRRHESGGWGCAIVVWIVALLLDADAAGGEGGSN